MTDTWRFQREIKPGVWVAACRACPKRLRPRHKFASSKEVTQWWKDHEANEEHRRNADPAVRRRRREEVEALRGRIFGVTNHANNNTEGDGSAQDSNLA